MIRLKSSRAFGSPYVVFSFLFSYPKNFWVNWEAKPDACGWLSLWRPFVFNLMIIRTFHSICVKICICRTGKLFKIILNSRPHSLYHYFYFSVSQELIAFLFRVKFDEEWRFLDLIINQILKTLLSVKIRWILNICVKWEIGLRKFFYCKARSRLWRI